MPIRFRSAYCNQTDGDFDAQGRDGGEVPEMRGRDHRALAGRPIAAGRAGAPGVEPPAEQPVTAPAGVGGAFEAKEFEDYFNEAANDVAANGAGTDGYAPVAVTESAAVPPPPPPPARRGLFLTLPGLILSVVVILLLLVLVFVLGVVIGRQTVPPRETAATQLRSHDRDSSFSVLPAPSEHK